MIKYNSLIEFLIIVIFLLSTAACNESARRSGERQTKSTQEIVSKSKELQNLEKVCRELPFFNKITPAVKAINRENDELFYYYQLKEDFNNLKDFYKKQLPQQGWILKKEQAELWENQIEYEKGQYWIQIAYGNFGKENYAINCKDLTLAK